MGAIQGSINQVLGVLAGGKLVPTMQKANTNVDDIKLAKQKQKAQVAKYKATIAKSRLAEYQSKEKLKELKGKGTGSVSIGGAKVTDANILAQIKAQSKGGK